MTILDLKKIIVDNDNNLNNISQINLFFDTKKMTNNEIVWDYNLENESILELEIL